MIAFPPNSTYSIMHTDITLEPGSVDTSCHMIECNHGIDGKCKVVQEHKTGHQWIALGCLFNNASVFGFDTRKLASFWVEKVNGQCICTSNNNGSLPIHKEFIVLRKWDSRDHLELIDLFKVRHGMYSLCHDE